MATGTRDVPGKHKRIRNHRGMIGLTGGTGFLGNVIARSLIKHDTPFRTLVRSREKALSLGLPAESVTVGNLFDPESLRDCFTGCTAVIHTAARISVDSHDEAELMKINVDGTQAVVNACRQTGVKQLVYVGSVEAFDLEGGSRPGNDGHVDPGKTILPYGRSKAHAINRVIDANSPELSTVVLSPTALLGPLDHAPSPMGRMILAYLRKKLPAYVHGGFDFVDVRDVASTCIRAAQSTIPMSHYLLSGTYLEIGELLGLLQGISGIPVRAFCVPEGVVSLFARVNVAVCRVTGRSPFITPGAVRLLSLSAEVHHEPATRDLDYAPRDIGATLEDTVAWFRARTE